MRGLISAAVIAVAILLQLAVADRIAFPGGAGPDLVLLTVAALALANGPMAGVLTGFCAGLALDVAPPAGHLVGQDALVFCLIGYACGLLATGPAVDGVAEGEHSALFEIGVTAAGAVCGEALAAGLGVMLSDPRVTWPAIKHVLPVAIGYDVLLSPFALFAVAAMLRLAGEGALASRSAASAAAGAARRRAAWSAVPSAGAVRQVAGTNAPRLKLSAQGKGDGWLSGPRGNQGRTVAARPGMVRHEPRFARGSGGALSSSRAGAAIGRGSLRSGSLRSGSARSVPTRFSSNMRGARLASTRLGTSLLGGSVFSGSSPLFTRSSPLSGRRTGSGSNGLAGTHQPRFRKTSVLSRVVNRMRSPAQRKSPGKGWLRGVSPGGGRIRALTTRSSSFTPRGKSFTRRGSGLPGRARGLSGRSPGRGWLRRSRGLGAAKIGPRFGSSRGGAARLRMRPRTLKKSWRRTGGFR
ncbi:MAG TPA: rod shape-determining protein MreD [Streptosporangiaceae bacterium]